MGGNPTSNNNISATNTAADSNNLLDIGIDLMGNGVIEQQRNNGNMVTG